MLEIKNTEVFGLYRALVASGNPMTVGEINTSNVYNYTRPENLLRGQKLGRAKSGSGHDNFLSGIIVTFDVKYPQYWTPEFQRYHFIQIISSQSKMHRLVAAASSGEFASMFNKYVDANTIKQVQCYVEGYNELADIVTNDTVVHEKRYHYFMKALSNLPMGYEMWMTVTTNYLQLKGIYKQRRNHKLKEDWGPFCDWIESLPRFMELIGEKN